MDDILFKLSDFCRKNKIEYAITGAKALSLLGVPSNFTPADIDIKVFHMTDVQRDKLKELQFLSGFDGKEHENGQSYAFYINETKINVIEDCTQAYDCIFNACVKLTMLDKERAISHEMLVQKVEYALVDKMKLGRPKDMRYLLDLITNISGSIKLNELNNLLNVLKP